MQSTYRPIPPAFMAPPVRMHDPGQTLRMGGTIIGVLVLVGMIAFHAAFFFGSHISAAVGLLGASMVIMDVAVGLSLIIAAVVASRPETTDGTRRALLMFAAVFLFAWLWFNVTFFRGAYYFP